MLPVEFLQALTGKPEFCLFEIAYFITVNGNTCAKEIWRQGWEQGLLYSLFQPKSSNTKIKPVPPEAGAEEGH